MIKKPLNRTKLNQNDQIHSDDKEIIKKTKLNQNYPMQSDDKKP
jgi:hypothetical protein